MKRFADLPNRKSWRSPSPTRRRTAASIAASPRACARSTRPRPRCSTRWRRRRCATAACCSISTASKFGEYLPLIRRQDVKGFIQKKPLWLTQPLNLDEVRKFAENMEFEAARFYRKAAETTRDASVRQLLIELAEAEVEHESLAQQARAETPYPERARRGGRDRAAGVSAAICAARTCRADGRLGVDLGAAVRRRLRHPQHLGDVPGRHGRLGRRRHLHGLCRGRLRRRLAHRARHAVAARHGMRGDDHDRRGRAHAALSDSRFLDWPPCWR